MQSKSTYPNELLLKCGRILKFESKWRIMNTYKHKPIPSYQTLKKTTSYQWKSLKKIEQACTAKQ